MHQNYTYRLDLACIKDKKFNILLAEIESEFVLNHKISICTYNVEKFDDDIRLFINKLVKTLCDKYTFNFLYEHIEFEIFKEILNEYGKSIISQFNDMLHIYSEKNDTLNDYKYTKEDLQELIEKYKKDIIILDMKRKHDDYLRNINKSPQVYIKY